MRLTIFLSVVAILLLVSSICPQSLPFPGPGNRAGISFHYVDTVTPGSNSNNGLTPATAWATLAHADATLPINAPLNLRYADGSWRKSATDWHGLIADYVFVQGPTQTQVYDPANGNNCAFAGSLTDHDVAPWKTTGFTLGIGADDYTTCPGDSIFSLGTTGVGTWIVTANLSNWAPTSQGTLWADMGNGANPGYTFGVLSSLNAFFIPQGGGQSALAQSAVVPPGLHTIAATFQRSSASGVQMYLDGLPSGAAGSTIALGSSNLAAGQPATIGGRYSGGSLTNWLAGSEFEIRVYNRVLTPTEIASASTETTASANVYYGPWKFAISGYLGLWAGNTAVPTVLRSYDGLYPYIQPAGTCDWCATRGFGNAFIYVDSMNEWWMNSQDTVGAYQYGWTISKSADGQNFTSVIDLVPGTGVNGQWFTNPADSSLHTIGVTGISQPTLLAAEMHPTAPDFSAWSAPITLTGIPIYTDNPYMAYNANLSNRYCVFENQNSFAADPFRYGLYCASSLLGTYSLVHPQGWTGWETYFRSIGGPAWGSESVNVLQMSDNPHHWRAWMITVPVGSPDPQKYFTSDSFDDFATWSQPIQMPLTYLNPTSPYWLNGIGVLRIAP